MNDDAWARANQDYFASAPTPQPAPTQPVQTGIGGVVPAGRRLKFGEALQVGLNLARSSWNIVTRAPGLLGVTALSLAFGVLLVLVYAKLAGGFAALESGGRYTVAVKDFPLLALLGVTGSMAQAMVVVVARDMFDNRPTSLVSAWGAAVARALDYGWDFATYLAIPVIMFEPGVGSFRAVKRSAELVRTRFGVQLAATGAISLAVFVCTIPVFIAAIVLGMMISPAVALGLAVLVLLTEMVVAATLQGVCSYVMYRFVTTGVVGGTFSETQLLRVLGGRPASRPAMAY
jgi:hypothetical protein